MGSGFSCFNPSTAVNKRRSTTSPDINFTGTGEQPPPLDETLGHSFCYVRSSARFISPTHSDRFLSPSQSLRFSQNQNGVVLETGFKAISGASVSANTFTPRTVDIYDSATDTDNHNNINININYNNNNYYNSSVKAGSNSVSVVNGFESTSSFSALPLQPLPRGDSDSGRGGFFMSGPIERGALSGPLDSDLGNGGGGGGVPFSAPLNSGMYVKKRRRKGMDGIRKAFNRNFPRPWVVPVRNFVAGRKEGGGGGGGGEEGGVKDDRDVQWASVKAGEDRVHVVVSEEHGWLFVGIYDGFNGPDAPEFLMGNLYKAMYKELEGLFWDLDDAVQDQDQSQSQGEVQVQDHDQAQSCPQELQEKEVKDVDLVPENVVKKVSFRSGEEIVIRRRRLWEFLAEEEPEDGLDLSGSERFAFSVDDALSVSKNSSGVNRRSLLLSKLRNGFAKHKEGSKLFAWKFGLDTKEQKEVENRIEETGNVVKSGRKKKAGPVDHDLVLRAMSRALEVTELAYLDMTDKVMDQYPELALMGSCLLAVLMKDEDVYVMNLGDSRAIVAQHEETEEVGPSQTQDSGIVVEGLVKESLDTVGKGNDTENEVPDLDMRLTALQLSTDHSTSIEEEVIRIKNEHPDDNNCIVNDRVKGRLKVTRAFGAGSLKQAKWNDSLLEMFRNEYIGNAPYISCLPSLRHHKLCPRDQFLVLSSDGLYQYFTNQEVVSHVDNFMERFPDGDPAQHLIEELLLRAAKKAGMDLHELLDIPQGDRRKYHDDVTVMIISLEGRIWKSSGKYL